MKKLFTFIAAMLVAFAVYADPVVLPATLDVNNVSFRSEGMPDFVVAEGDYAGTYFDMGAHDTPSDTLLYAEWDVTIEPIKYVVAVDVYNTNSWRVQLHLLNQAGDTVKALRYKGSWAQCGNYSIGVLDLSDLAAGNYKVRIHAATAYSAIKLKDVIFEADYQGVSVDLPGTMLPAYAELSSGATVSNGAISFAPSTANNEYAIWNVSFAEKGSYKVAIDMTAPNGHTYGVALLSADGETTIGSVAEAQAWDTGIKQLGEIAVPAAGDYKVKLTNATQWSEAVINTITFSNIYTVAGDNESVFGTTWAPTLAANDMVLDGGIYTFTKEKVLLNAGNIELKVVKNRDWDYAYPAENIVLNIPQNGYYDITVDFIPGGNTVAAEASMFTIDNGFYLIGKIEGVEGWAIIDLSDDRKLDLNPENNQEYMIADVDLDLGDEIKIVKVENNAIANWYPDPAGNYVVDAFHAGTTNIYFHETPIDDPYWYEGQIYVDFTQYRRQVANWATMCLPYAGELQNATAYDVTSCLTNEIIVEPIEGNMVAGKPYIIKPADPAEDVVVIPSGLKANAPDNSGVLQGNLGNEFDLAPADEPYSNYVLSGGLLHLVVAGEAGQSVKVGQYRAYLHIGVTSAPAPALRIVEAGNEATNIENLGADENAVKFIQNGQLFIKRNGVVYSATGAVVK